MTFHVSRVPPPLLSGTGPPDPGELEGYRQSQAALLRRRLTLSAALKQPGVANLPLVRAQGDPVGWLEDALRVSFGPGPELLRVELDGEPA